MLKRFLLLFLLVYPCCNIFCQHGQYIAELNAQHKSNLSDTVIIKKNIELYKICLNENRFDSAAIYVNRVMALSKMLKYKQGTMSALNAQGAIKYRMSQYDSALDYFMQALEIAKEIKLEKSIVLITTNIGELNVVTGNDPELGLKQLEEAEIPLQHLNAQADLIALYIRLSECYQMTGNSEKESQYIKKAVEAGSSLIKDTSIKGLEKNTLSMYYRMALFRKGQLLIENKEYTSALALYFQLLSGVKESAGQKERLLYEAQLTQIYLETEQFDSALLYANIAFAALKKDSIPDLYRYMYALRSNAYEGLGKTDSALEDYKLFKEISDQIFSAESLSRMNSLQKKNEIKEKDNQIMYADKERKFYELLFAVSLIAAAGAFAFFFINKRARRLEKEVYAQKEQMLLDRANIEKNELQLQIADLEQKALRAQMNPHFIFNSLNSIQHYVINNDIDGANKYISLLGSLIRLTLYYSSKKEIKLSEEISYINSFLELERIRLQNAFGFTISIQEGIDTDQCFIPPLLLQPFVENAIRHGIKYLEARNGKIEVRVDKTEGGIKYVITDNGVGREVTSRFRKNFHKEYQSKGIELSRNRLALLDNGKAKSYIQIYDLKDKASVPTGTQVVIFIPG